MEHDEGWKPQHIVLDSTELVSDVRLSSARMVLLRAYCQRYGARVVIPRVVRLEVERKIEAHVREAATLADRANTAMRRAGSDGPKWYSSHGDAWVFESMKESFATRLEWLGASELQFPDVTHAEVLNRLLKGRRPFGTKSEGDVGYRDYLIWMNILSLEGPTAFVTRNSRDFSAGTGSKDELHPDLAQDTAGTLAEVRLFHGLESLAEKILRPGFPAIDTSDLVVEHSDQQKRLEEFAEEHLAAELKAIGADLYLSEMSDRSTFQGTPTITTEVRWVAISEVTKGVILDEGSTISFTCIAYIGLRQNASYSRDDGGHSWSILRRVRLQAEIEYAVNVTGVVLSPTAVSLGKVVSLGEG